MTITHAIEVRVPVRDYNFRLQLPLFGMQTVQQEFASKMSRIATLQRVFH